MIIYIYYIYMIIYIYDYIYIQYIYMCVCVYEGYSISKVNFIKGVGHRKQYVQSHVF